MSLKKKIIVTFANPSWSWAQTKTMTPEECQAAHASTDYTAYDNILGKNSNNARFKIFDSDSPRKKALIILNQPHHLKDATYWGQCAAGLIMSRFPGRVANVKINDCIRKFNFDVKRKITYGDMFDGYIFYIPYAETIYSHGIPGIVDEAFLPEMLRRYELNGIPREYIDEWAEGDIPTAYNTVKTFRPLRDEQEKLRYDSIILRHFVHP